MLTAFRLVEERGIEKGIKLGEERAVRRIALKLLLQKFVNLDDKYKELLDQQELEDVEDMIEALIEIEDVEELEKYFT